MVGRLNVLSVADRATLANITKPKNPGLSTVLQKIVLESVSLKNVYYVETFHTMLGIDVGASKWVDQEYHCH